jgi:hypothetical protein
MRLRKDNSGAIGLPVRILIIVVVAAASIMAILGFLVATAPRIEYVEVRDVFGNRVSKLVCDDYRPEEAVRYYRGSTRPDPTNKSATLKPDDKYTTHLIIYVKDKDNKPIPNVEVSMSGCGVSDVGATDGDGKVKLSLEGCKLEGIEFQRQQGRIIITATTTLPIINQDISKSVKIFVVPG